MPNVLPVLNDHIRRLASREARAHAGQIRKLATEFRREIAALKRLIKTLATRVMWLEKGSRNAAAASAGKSSGEGAQHVPEQTRFRADGLRSHRARLGISARDYGRLVGVSGLTVYNWESGKSRPRRRQMAGLLNVRGLGKRDVERRLAELDT